MEICSRPRWTSPASAETEGEEISALFQLPVCPEPAEGEWSRQSGFILLPVLSGASRASCQHLEAVQRELLPSTSAESRTDRPGIGALGPALQLRHTVDPCCLPTKHPFPSPSFPSRTFTSLGSVEYRGKAFPQAPGMWESEAGVLGHHRAESDA